MRAIERAKAVGNLDIEEYHYMLEDPKLTLKILKYFARDDIGFPSNKGVDDLVKEIPEATTREQIVYHVICAEENGLLKAYIHDDSVMGRGGRRYGISYMDGLTARGGEYVRASEGRFWDEAWNYLHKQGSQVTTQTLLLTAKQLFLKSIDVL